MVKHSEEGCVPGFSSCVPRFIRTIHLKPALLKLLASHMSPSSDWIGSHFWGATSASSSTRAGLR